MRCQPYVFVLLMFLLACEKEVETPIFREDLIGSWVNQANSQDILLFDEWRNLIVRGSNPWTWPQEAAEFLYNSYFLSNDSIEFVIGIQADTYKCKIRFPDQGKQSLIIEGMDSVPPFLKGEEFIKRH